MSEQYILALRNLHRESPLPNWPEAASSFSYVFVGGLWSHFYPMAYVASRKGLVNRGIAVHAPRFDSRLSVEANGAVLAEEFSRILETHNNKPLIILGHSKGSLDTLEAIRQNPALGSHVHRLISIQSPFGGSPYAVRSSPTIS